MNQVEVLFEKYNNGTATKEEIILVESWYISYKTQNDSLSNAQIEEEYKMGLADLLKRIDIKPVRLWPRIAVAASILFVLSFWGYYLFDKQKTQQIVRSQKQDIAPGANKATLTLANGQKIVLTKGLSGKLAQQGNTAIQMNSGNAIAYVSSTANITDDSPVAYNTLSTSNGEQSPYPLILADGTKVWLNAASSVTFPTAFAGKERLVKVTGEAYFEVAHNAAYPFRIAVKGLVIEDIGTHFNINAYDDEPVIKTTLLEGSVKVSKGAQMVVIKPGQQAVVNTNNMINVINNADTEEAVAWKNGFFQFDHADIKTVMRQFERWYNVKVSYEGQTPNDKFSGKLYRNVNISEALEILNYSKIHFNIIQLTEGKEIIITP